MYHNQGLVVLFIFANTKGLNLLGRDVVRLSNERLLRKLVK